MCPGGTQWPSSKNENLLSADCLEHCEQCEEGKFRHEHGDAYCSYCSAFDEYGVPNPARDGCICEDGKGRMPLGLLRPATTIRIFDRCTAEIATLGDEFTVSGTLEVRRDESSPWGSVCDDYFGEEEATVACAQIAEGLGLKGGQLKEWGGAPNSYCQWEGIASNYQDIFLDNLDCQGYEQTLGECFHNGWGIHDCSHQEDQWISCTFENDNTVAVRECISCWWHELDAEEGEDGDTYCVERSGFFFMDQSLNFYLYFFAAAGVIVFACICVCKNCTKNRSRENSVLAGGGAGNATSQWNWNARVDNKGGAHSLRAGNELEEQGVYLLGKRIEDRRTPHRDRNSNARK